jgi:hypothetical protein
VDVTAPGYQKWTYPGQPVLHLQSGAEVHSDALLQPSHDVALGDLQYLIPQGYVD